MDQSLAMHMLKWIEQLMQEEPSRIFAEVTRKHAHVLEAAIIGVFHDDVDLVFKYGIVQFSNETIISAFDNSDNSIVV